MRSGQGSFRQAFAHKRRCIRNQKLIEQHFIVCVAAVHEGFHQGPLDGLGDGLSADHVRQYDAVGPCGFELADVAVVAGA